MTAPEVIITYRIDDLPPRFATVLPPDAAPRRSLFWIARQGSAAIGELMQSLPEPPMEQHVDEAMALATLVARVAARSRLLADIVHPDPDGAMAAPRYGGIYKFGFHTGTAAHVEAHLRDGGHTLVTVRAIFDRIATVDVKEVDGGAPIQIFERWARWDEGGQFRLLDSAAPGLFTIEIPELPFDAWALLGFQSIVETSPLRAGSHTELRLEPSPSASSSRSTSSSTGEWSQATEIVARVHAEPLHIGAKTFTVAVGTPNDEGVVEIEITRTEDGEFYSSSTQPVPLASDEAPFEATRFEAAVRGIREALPGAPFDEVMPAALVPLDLLAIPSLVDARDFAEAAFRLEPIARHRGVRDVRAFATKYGLDPCDDAFALDVWFALPDTVLAHNTLGRSLDTIGELAACADGMRWLEALAESWTERAFVDGPAAVAYLPVFSEIGYALDQVLPVDRLCAAQSRGLARWRSAAIVVN